MSGVPAVKLIEEALRIKALVESDDFADRRLGYKLLGFGEAYGTRTSGLAKQLIYNQNQVLNFMERYKGNFMSKFIVFINGAPHSGKDTFASMVMNLFHQDIVYTCEVYNANISTVDLVKDAAVLLGWNYVKGPKARKLLAGIKQLWVEYNDGPFKDIQENVEIFDRRAEPGIMFVHCREPEELARFMSNELVTTSHKCSVLLRREDNDTPISNDSDRNVEDFEYMYTYVIPTSEDWKKLVYAHAVAFFSSITGQVKIINDWLDKQEENS